MKADSSPCPEEAFNGPNLIKQHLEIDDNEALSISDSSVNKSADCQVATDTSFNQEESGFDPKPALPGGFQCGGSNFYSFEFAEKLFRSLPFMISQPKKRFLRSWETDTDILPKLGVPLDITVKIEPEEIEGELRMARNEIRKIDRTKSKKERVFQCENCPESFQSLRLFRRHVGMVHLKSFNCPRCSRLFSSPTNVKRHSLTCKDIKEKRERAKVERPMEKRWECLICNKKLSTVDRVKRHFQRLHPNEDPKASTASIGGKEPVKAVVNEANDPKRQMCQCNICGKTATRYLIPMRVK